MALTSIYMADDNACQQGQSVVEHELERMSQWSKLPDLFLDGSA